MPAVYSIDLIEKRDKKKRMDRSIIKGWNVHYQTLEEVEEEMRAKKRKSEEKKELWEAAEEEPAGSSGQAAESEEDSAYNKKTGSYSGNYGKAPVEDAAVKSQIDEILNEKRRMIENALSAVNENGAAD